MALVGAVVAASGACRGPTQITIELTTDIRCDDVRGTAISVGDLGTYEQRPASALTPTCDPATGRIGSIVVVPSGEKDEQVAIRVVMGFGRDPAECVPPAYGPGCVVARRALRFIPAASLLVPIFLGAVCNGVPCEATTTCTSGQCSSAIIEDSSRCIEAGGCGESALGAGPQPRPDSPIADASPATDATTAATVPLDPAAACGRPSTYVDEFAGGALGPEWVESVPGSAVEQGGMLVVKAPANTPRLVESRFAVNLTEDRLRIEVPRPPIGDTTAEIGLRAASGGELAFSIREGVLRMRLVAGTADEKTVPFDPSSHRWLQIRESNGQVQWETSPDAVTWTSLRSVATPSFARWVKIVVAARGGLVAGEAYFDRLNAGRPRASWCKAATHTDDFDDGVTGSQWTSVVSGACSYAEANGEVRFTMTGLGSSYCAYES